MSIGQLKLIEGWVDGVLPDGYGGEAEAEFGIRAQLDGGQVGTYKLMAMNPSHYETWYLETLEEGELAEGEVRPLEVPAAILAVTGLVTHVQREYLNPDHPYRLNLIADCLEGPVEVEATTSNLAA